MLIENGDIINGVYPWDGAFINKPDIETGEYYRQIRRVSSVPCNLSHCAATACTDTAEGRERSFSMLDNPFTLHLVNDAETKPDAIATISSQFNPSAANESFTITMPEEQVKTEKSEYNPALNISAQQISLALQRHGKNIGKVLERNLLSVAIPTAMRELVAKTLLPALVGRHQGAAHVAMGSVAIAIPIALQLLGIARDMQAGAQTRASLSARLANIALITGASSALVACGGLAAAANALIAAVFIYVPMRDITQYFLQLTDNSTPEFNFNGCAKSAIAYGSNQVAVSEGMELLSGALQPLLGQVAANMLGKAIINLAGEAVDEITFRGFKAQETRNPALVVDLKLRPAAMINYQTATDQLLNTIASRTSLFAAAYSAIYALPHRGMASSMLIGAMLGASYLPFLYCHAQQPARDPLDIMEAGRLPVT